MAILKHLDLSTAHITGDDNVRLTSDPDLNIRFCDHEHGYIIFVNSEIMQSDLEDSMLSDDFICVYFYAIEKGCTLINFDSDGDIIDGLHVNNW